MIPNNTFTATPQQSVFRSPNDEPYTPLSQSVLGGTSLNNGNAGRLVKRWACSYDNTNILVKDDGNITRFSLPVAGATSISLSFDTNMAVVLAWTTTTSAFMHYYNTVTSSYITREFPGITSCRVAVDEPLSYYTSSSDVIFGYVKAGNLYYRQQRDRYDIEYLVGPATTPLIKMGMNVGNRFQFHLSGNTVVDNAATFPVGIAGPVAQTGSTLYSTSVMADSPAFYFRMNDLTTSAFNTVSQSYTGSYTADVTLRQQAFVTNDTNSSSVKFGAASTTSRGGTLVTNFTTNFTSALTAEFWFNAPATGNDVGATLMAKREYYASNVSTFPVSLIWSQATSTVVVNLSAGNDFAADATLTSPVLSTNTDYYVAFVYRATGLCELFINGVVVASTTITFTINDTSTDVAWTIGSSTENSGGVGNSSFNGRIGEAALYGTAISATRIAAHYVASGAVEVDPFFNNVSLLLNGEGATVVDSSINIRSVTRNPGVTISTAQSKFGASSVYFSGTGTGTNSSLLTVPETLQPGTGDFTIETWIRPDSVTVEQRHIFTKQSGSGVALQIYQSGTSVGALLRSSNGTNLIYLPSLSGLVADQWAHIALVRSSGIATLYLNGVGTTPTASTHDLTDTNATCYVGTIYSGDLFFRGYMDKFRITNGIARYTSNFTPT